MFLNGGTRDSQLLSCCLPLGCLSRLSCVVTTRHSTIASLTHAHLHCRDGLGVHLNVTEGVSLTGFGMRGKTGFREWWAAQAVNGETEEVARRALAAEVRAQLDRYVEVARGRPGHVDGHQHFHVTPGVPQVLAQVLREFYQGEPFLLRVPHDIHTATIEQKLSPFLREVSEQALAAMAVYSQIPGAIIRPFTGLAMMGTALTREAVREAVRGLAPGTVLEIMCHPGQSLGGEEEEDAADIDDFARSPDREHERALLGKRENIF